MLEYQKNLNTRHDASDPWGELANAIVEQAADDYRRNVAALIKYGLSMSEIELSYVRRYIADCKSFFESGWGDFLAHGLAGLIWQKLQAERAGDLAEFERRLPYMQKHRRKLERKRENAERRLLKNKARQNRQRKFKKKVAAIRAATENNNKTEVDGGKGRGRLPPGTAPGCLVDGRSAPYRGGLLGFVQRGRGGLTMDDYISREAVYSIFNGEHNLYTWYEIESAIDAIPAADVRPVVRGRWERPQDSTPRSWIFQCSVCGERAYYPVPKYFPKNGCGYDYCPNCGADMRLHIFAEIKARRADNG